MSQLHLLSPLGFRGAGVYAGIKSKQMPDVALLVADAPCSAAAVFTKNRVVAAPVIVGRKHVRSGRLRGCVVNAGNANACTGKQGERDALRMCALAASVAGGDVGARATEFLPSSTGIIGHLLPMEKMERGIVEAGQYLGNSLEHANLFCDAILTTDLKRKVAAAEVMIGRKRVTIGGACKGSGMIGPRLGLHATMLAYLTTDAAVSPAILRRVLKEASDVSFNAVTVDDQTSTNDTCVLMASGASGAKVSSATETKKFMAALMDVCRSLAYQIAADGEGATKVVAITVRGAKTDRSAQIIARSIANSPLVKCAMHGNDPNWGRIMVAAGLCGEPLDSQRCTLQLQGVTVFSRGVPAKFDAEAASRSLAAKEVKVELNCGSGKGVATVWTCDLSKDYVSINADYHT